jgi:predicted transcriptional regulator of viral defense system
LVRRDESLSVSDPERTVLDALGRPELSGGLGGVAQIVASAKPSLRWPRLAEYAERLGNRSLARRLGYLLDRVRPDVDVPSALRRRLAPRAGEPFVPLGPPRTFPRRGRHNRAWGIIENVPERQLFAEVDIR